MKCDKCKNKEYCDCHSMDYDACVESGYASYKPITNYDRIVSKTPEELAKWLAGVTLESDTLKRIRSWSWLDWLQQEGE